MKVLFAGDSITNGKLGESFVTLIQASHPGFRIQNIGRDGETFRQIVDGLLKHLKQDNDFDLVVLQGGYNDLLLPTFLRKGKLLQFAYHQQIKKGNLPLPANADEAFSFLQQAIKEIKQSFQGKIMLVTVGCLGENLHSDLNRQRNGLNGIFERVAAVENISIAKPHEMFDSFLANKVQSDYCLDNFWAVTLLDRFTTLWSAKRKLHLTIDGVHLNRPGAEIFAKAVMATIKNTGERTAAAL